MANKQVRVLFVDDDKKSLVSLKEFLKDYDKGLLSSIKNILKEIDFDISTASDTGAALEAFRKQKPHICLIKVMVKYPYSYSSLEKEEGIKLINAMKEINPKVKCIAYASCNPGKKLYFLLKELGADDAIRRPANPRFVAGKLNVMVWEYHLNEEP